MQPTQKAARLISSVSHQNRTRLLMVAHTERQDRIRVISARKATKKEERFYAEAK